MVVAFKNSMRTLPIYLPCVLLEQRKISPFSFSLTHTLTVFLSISSHELHLSKWLNISLCFALSGTHTHWPNMALCLFCFSPLQGRMAFASFFSFSSTCPTRFATLLNKRSQTMLFASPNFLPSFNRLDMLQSSLIKRHGWLEDFWNQAHKWALTRHVGSKWAGLYGCHVHPTISPSSTLWRRSSTQVFS